MIVKLRRWAKELVFFVAVFILITLWQQRNLLDNDIQAPNASFVTLSGNTSPLYQPGKETLVYFFAPWCTFCDLSIANVEAVKNNREITLVALDYQSVAEVSEFIERQGLDLPVLLGDSELAVQYGVTMFPTYYLISEQGDIEGKSVGYSTELGLRARVAI